MDTQIPDTVPYANGPKKDYLLVAVLQIKVAARLGWDLGEVYFYNIQHKVVTSLFTARLRTIARVFPPSMSIKKAKGCGSESRKECGHLR